MKRIRERIKKNLERMPNKNSADTEKECHVQKN